MSELTVAITATNHDAAAYLARGANHPLSASFAVDVQRPKVGDKRADG